MPRADEAEVPSNKILGYLLDLGHSVGRFKARVFRGLGYDERNSNLLVEQLLEIARSEDYLNSTFSAHGQKYIIDGVLKTPSGRDAKVRTVWIIEGEASPRFVTAYPR